jgi:hypothetical protein
MRAKALVSAVAGTICTALVIASVAWASGAATTVTIKGPDHVFGTIKSSSKSCLGGRKVVVYKQTGSTQNPRVDQPMASDISSRVGNHGSWDVGNPGLGHGKFYAAAKKKPGCKAGFSKTVKF